MSRLLESPYSKHYVKVFKISLHHDDSIAKDKSGRLIDSTVAGSFVRLFTVVKEGDRFSICLPIVRYSSKDTVGSKFSLRQHAIIYTEKSSPKTKSQELAMLGEDGKPETWADNVTTWK